jgi:hypothetical protein
VVRSLPRTNTAVLNDGSVTDHCDIFSKRGGQFAGAFHVHFGEEFEDINGGCLRLSLRLIFC